MAVKLLTLVDPRSGESTTELDTHARAALERAFAVGEGDLVRVWDAPGESEASQFLIVRDPPDVRSIAAVVEGLGLSLDSVVPVISAQPTGDPLVTEAQILDALPETTPDTLLAPAPIAFRGVLVPTAGVVMCPTCGGWGGHLFQHP